MPTTVASPFPAYPIWRRFTTDEATAQRADTHAAQGNDDLILLMTSGPPGVEGQQGNLLTRQTKIIIGVQEDWGHIYQILYLLENVVPHEAVTDQFQDIATRLGTTPMVVDAKDGGIISRPTLWWNTPWPITQTFHQTMWHLTNPIANQLQPETGKHRRSYNTTSFYIV